MQAPKRLKLTSDIYTEYKYWRCCGFFCNGTYLRYRVGHDPELCHLCHNVVYQAVRKALDKPELHSVEPAYEEVEEYNMAVSKQMSLRN